MNATAVAVRPLERCVVVVTPRSFGLHDPSLRTELEARVGRVVYKPGPLDAAPLAEILRDADGLIAGLDDVSAEVLASSHRLRVVARYGVGTDRVDLEAAERNGVVVTVTPGANSNAVAELSVALLLALARPLFEGREAPRAGAWPALHGVELSGRTLGLVGLGRIGSLVATKAEALGMSVSAFDPYLRARASRAPGAGRVRLADLATVLQSSDFVSLHAPLTEETRAMLGSEQFAIMKTGAALVNTARGQLVDEGALIAALDHGPLRAAALDVLCQEPPLPGSTSWLLLERPDVIVTPHMAPHTVEATAAMGRMAMEELLSVLSGRPARYGVTAVAAPGSPVGGHRRGEAGRGGRGGRGGRATAPRPRDEKVMQQ